MFMDFIGDRFRQVCIDVGFISVCKVVQVMGINEMIYVVYENGQNFFDVKRVVLYVKIFKVLIVCFFDGIFDDDCFQSENEEDVQVESKDLFVFYEFKNGEKKNQIFEIDLVVGFGGGGIVGIFIIVECGIIFVLENVCVVWILLDWVF